MKTRFTDLGIFAQEALRHLTEHCPKMLEVKKKTGEIDSVPGDDRRGSSEEDPNSVSANAGEEPALEDSESSGTRATQQLVDEDSRASGDEGNDLPLSGSGVAGSGDRRDGSMGSDAAGNGRRGSGRRGSGVENTEAEIVEEIKNQNHFYLNEEIFWTEFSNKDRFDANIEAIHLVREVEKRELPAATEEEKQKLALYAGWGSVNLRNIPNRYNIGEAYNLSEEEKENIYRNSLDAYYTSPAIIKPLWQSIQDHLNFKGGEILEPAVGVGNFLGFAPKEIVERSNFHGTELDNLSGRIAKQLYPDVNLQVRGFEDFHPPENYFDLVITNVPFGQNRPYDKNYQNSHSIHNFFICKSLSLLKPGAIGVYLTSSFTMDSVGTKARREMNEKAHLLSAIRLPMDALKEHSNIEVMMDVLIFQRRVTPRLITEQEPEWIDTHSSLYRFNPYIDPCELVTNNFFINNPGSLAGQMTVFEGDPRYGVKCRRGVIADSDRPFDELFPAILNASLSSPRVQEILKTSKNTATSKNRIFIAEDPKEKLVELETSSANLLGSLVRQNGKIYQIKYRSEDGLDNKTTGVEIIGNAKKLKKLAAFIALRDTLRDHYKVMKQTEGDDPQYISHRALLTAKYEGFVSRYGYLNDKANVVEYKTDPECCKVITLENRDPDTKQIKRASIFTERVLGKDREITHTDSVKDAVSLSLNRFNSIDIEYISGLCEKDVSTVLQELEGQIYKNPTTKEWEIADLYLSGNVRHKLQQAERAAEYDADYKGNVTALEKVIPQDVPAEDIAVRLGVSWVPIKEYKEFLAKLLRTPENNINLQQKESDGSWTFYFCFGNRQ